jgi:hypothetical protein
MARGTAAAPAGANKYSPKTYRADKAQAKKFAHQQQFAKARSVIEGGAILWVSSNRA